MRHDSRFLARCALMFLTQAGDFFAVRAGRIELCNVPLPVREFSATH